MRRKHDSNHDSVWTATEKAAICQLGIQSPTLVVIGDRDIVRPEHAVQMYRLFPHGQLAILPDTDHMKIVDRAEWLAPMVDAFLEL